VKDVINGVCYQRYEKHIEQQKKVFQMFNVCVAEENLQQEI